VEFGGGIGDHLLCSVVFRELRERGQTHMWMMTNYDTLFHHNADVDAVQPVDWRVSALLKRAGVRRYRPIYTLRNRETDRDQPPPRHIIAYMCELSGLRGSVALRPYLQLLEQERAIGSVVPRQIAIQSSGMGARYPMGNKEWYPERFQTVVTALRDRYNFVQLGTTSDPPLDGAIDLRGKTSLRESAAILSQSLAFVGQVGFLMHLARAVDCRSVIVYGGREWPDTTGYICNENLFSTPPCAPCWLWNRCDYDRRCMQVIHADAVVAAVERQVERYGTPLPVQREIV
jgi:ADP-heptose:LPS heptosyltransferase